MFLTCEALSLPGVFVHLCKEVLFNILALELLLPGDIYMLDDNFLLIYPQAIFCYWITSNLFSLTYGLGESLNFLFSIFYGYFTPPPLLPPKKRRNPF